MLLNFAGREYRPSAEELAALAGELEERAERPEGIYRRVDDATFAPLAARIRDALDEHMDALELDANEGAALLLAIVGAPVRSGELDRFTSDYLAENEWTSRPLSRLLSKKRSIGVQFALEIGRWFFEDGLATPIGGIDAETGEDLWPRAADFAWLEGANTAFADAASMWARINGSLADPHVHVGEMLLWLRSEQETAQAEVSDSVDEDAARSSARAWAMRKAALWLEVAANRSRLPWEPPQHEA